MRTVRILFTVSTILFLGSVTASAQDVMDILKKMDEVLYAPKDMTAKTKIIIVDKNGNKKVREAEMMQKGSEMRLFRFTAPASQAGIATLSLPNDVMYLYLPSFSEERRISSSVKNQKFAGTDFSYDDMEAKPYAEKYTGKLLGTEGDVYILELKPTNPKSQYSKLVSKVNKENYYPVSGEYYDKGNNKIKESSYVFEKIGKYWNPKEMTMIDLKKKHKTTMITYDVKYDTGLTDDDFSVRKLKQ